MVAEQRVVACGVVFQAHTPAGLAGRLRVSQQTGSGMTLRLAGNTWIDKFAFRRLSRSLHASSKTPPDLVRGLVAPIGCAMSNNSSSLPPVTIDEQYRVYLVVMGTIAKSARTHGVREALLRFSKPVSDIA